MLKERFAIYCYSLEKTAIASVTASTNKSLGNILFQSAWLQVVFEKNNGVPPQSFQVAPSDFCPKILSYSQFEELKPALVFDRCQENIFVILMPEFDVTIDIELLQVVVMSRYSDYLRKGNIPTVRQLDFDDIIEVKPNLSGIGINFNAMWKRFRSH